MTHRGCARARGCVQVRYTPGRHVSIRQFLPEQTVSISGMSKEVSGTGLRLGFCAGPLGLISLIRSIQSNTSSVRSTNTAIPPRPPCVSAQPTRTAALARYRTATGRVWCMWA